MLSRLSADANVPPESFRAILEYMLGFIEKDKQTEGLIEKLCNRFPQTTGKKVEGLTLSSILGLCEDRKGAAGLCTGLLDYVSGISSQQMVCECGSSI